MKLSSRQILLAVMLISSSLFFQNCGNQFAVNEDMQSLFKANDKIDANCLDSSEYDACIFYKSPVVHKGDVLAVNERWETELPKWQHYGVTLPRSLSSSYFTNGTIEVLSEQRIGAQEVENYQVAYSKDNQVAISEAMSYYWGSTLINHFRKTAGYTYLDNKNVRIVPDSSITGFSSETNTIYLGETEQTSGLSVSFDASVLMHLMGEANIYHATNGAVYDLSVDDKHLDCGITGFEVYKKDCCASRFGCSKAVTSGLSDYLVSVVFPSFPAIGEALSNSVYGIEFCDINRNPDRNRVLNVKQAYGACADDGRPGQVYAMGSFYASIWYSVRTKVFEADGARGIRDLDRLYMELLKELTPDDDFLTVLDKIRTVDASISEGWLTSFFEVEYQSRELQ